MAYDSDPLDNRLAEERGIELIAPHKTNRANRRLKTVGYCGDIKNAGGYYKWNLHSVASEVELKVPKLTRHLRDGYY